MLVWTVGEMLNSPSNSATNADLSPSHLRGRYQGVFSLSWSAAGFIAPIIGAAVLQYAGPTTLWLGCFGSLVVASSTLAAPARRRRAAELGPPRSRRAAEVAAAETPATRSRHARTRPSTRASLSRLTSRAHDHA